MAGKYKIKPNLDYLQNKPKNIWWEVITPKGYKLNALQDHDLVFDKIDYKIRQLTA